MRGVCIEAQESYSNRRHAAGDVGARPTDGEREACPNPQPRPTLPNTSSETPQLGWAVLAMGIITLLSGGLLLRRARR